MGNIIAIVGRPNVGKSTLFNRLVGERKAIMDNISGVTRDRHYGMGHWNGKEFSVIDTGGYVMGSEDIFEEAIRKQVELAIEESDIVLFMVDVDAGLTGLDNDFAKVLRKSKKPLFVVANKADNTERFHMSSEFYKLGMGDVFPVSSINGSGTGELLDEVVKHLEDPVEDTDEELPKIAILGKPNVGKSSLLNVLLGKERSIVTDIAGTTRDAINSRFNAFGMDLLLIDTAGLRKKSKVHEDIEFYSVLRTVRTLETADVCMVLIDAENGLEGQDLNIVSLAYRNKKGIVILVNKWDLLEKETNTAKEYEKAIRKKLEPMDHMPIVFTSVLNKQRIHKALEEAVKVHEQRKRKIKTSVLNDKLLPEIEKVPPPAIKGKYVKIKYITQLPTPTPVFAFFCNNPKYIKTSYERFLENKIRKHFGFEGVPLKLVFREK